MTLGPRKSIFQVYCDVNHPTEVDEEPELDEDTRETIDIECETDNLFNVFDELGDDAPDHPLCIPAFKLSFIKESDLAIQREIMRTRFLEHSQQSARAMKDEGKEDFKQWKTQFDASAREREHADNKQINHIHEEIVDTRKKEIKRHAKKWTRHESNTKLKMKELLVSIQGQGLHYKRTLVKIV